MLQVYDSLTKEKKVFQSIEDGHIKLYVCGVTVYDYCHIGHARTYLAFDVMVRYLRSKGFTVTYVRNITDIDDKIIKRAQLTETSWDSIVQHYITEMYADFDALNILRPDIEPRATETIGDMIHMIEGLIDKGFAYQASNGDVYYAVEKFQDYGKLSGQTLNQLQAGERVEINEAKKSPFDFVLWKAAKPGEPSWDSPWGKGRPGWHIECSCMTKCTLGDQFDIHGGGADLKFPHHENEIAQSEAANNSPYANYWLHTGMVKINEEKMSKSLGNFFIIRDVLKNYAPEVVRYFLIAGHYRSSLNYSEENLQQAKSALTRLYLTLRDADPLPVTQTLDPVVLEQFHAAMDDDFNMPEVVALLFGLAHKIQKDKDTAPAQASILVATLKHIGNILGILQLTPSVFLQECSAHVETQKIEQLVLERKEARQARDWAKADSIRGELEDMGIVLEDQGEQTLWRLK